MAGQPMRRQMLAELLRRARLELGDEGNANDEIAMLQYVAERVSSGDTLTVIVRDIGRTIGAPDLRREVLAKWTKAAEERAGGEWVGLLARARLNGAHALFENAQARVEATPALRDELAKTKQVNDLAVLLAGRWNSELAEQKGGGLTVNLSVGGAALDAFRQRAIAEPQPELLGSGEVLESEVL